MQDAFFKGQRTVRAAAVFANLMLIGVAPVPAQVNSTQAPVRLRQDWSYRWEARDRVVDSVLSDSTGWRLLDQVDQTLTNDPGLPDLWLRTRLPQGQWHDPALYLESLQISFHVYVNETPVYSFHDPFSRLEGQFSGGQYHVISLPYSFSEQVLTIRIMNPPTDRSGLRKAVRVGSGADLLMGLVRKNFDQVILGFFFLFVGVFFLVVFLRDLKQKSFYSFGLFALCSGVYVVAETPLTRVFFNDIVVWRYLIEVTSLYLIPVGLLLFIEYNIRSPLLIWLRRLWQFHLAYAVAAIGLVVFGVISLSATVGPFQMMVMVDVVLILVAAIREAVKGDVRARMFGFGVGGLMLFALHDNLGHLLIIPKVHNLFPWGVFIFILFMGYILERRMAETYVKREKERAKLREAELRAQATERELNLAASIQKAILPKSMPAVDGFDVAGVNVPSREVSGDYYDGFVLPDGRLVLVIADVSGKGVPAALLVSMLHASLHAFFENRCSLPELTAKLNRLVHRSSTPETFITFFVGTLNVQTGAMEYVNAGHNPPLLMRVDGAVHRLHTRGVALGVIEDRSFSQGHAELRHGDRLLLYTDGISEATNANDDLFMEQRLEEHMGTTAGRSAEDFVRLLMDGVHAFAAGVEQSDDITMLYVRRL
jgi:serine phosphatase RsbU (regulator of sigma subunit)